MNKTSVFSRIVTQLVAFVCQCLISLRYRVEIKGLELLTPTHLNRKGGILFLPNHTAHIDPFILFLWLWPKFRMRPLTVEYMVRQGFLAPLFKLVRAVPIPNFDHSVNQIKIKNGEKALKTVAIGLKNGDNFLLYPGSRLKRQAKELIGGSSGTHALLQECPEANLVLIRTTGLWGSSFSRALTGTTPDLSDSLLQGIKAVLKNLIFFTPRRKILIEVEPNPTDLSPHLSKLEFNRHLENWYNRYPDEQGNILDNEPLQIIPYSIWNKKVPTPFQAEKKSISSAIPISDKVQTKIYTKIKQIVNSPSLQITPTMDLSLDLGMDSLNIAELVGYLSKNHNMNYFRLEEFKTVQDVLNITQGSTQKLPQININPKITWPEEKNRPYLTIPDKGTISEVFLKTCERMGSLSACGDDQVGILNYKELKLKVLVLAQYFRAIPETRIAVMLPASVGVFVVILALYFAKKVPVMLNWTLGPRYLEEMMKISGAQTVFTSWKFIDGLSNVDFGNLVDKIHYLEDIKKQMSFKMKMRGFFLSRRSVPTVLLELDLNSIDENDPCVILFTSGTEAVPKGVPLSHKNILASESGSQEYIKLNSSDIIYGVLPPFHSFGFSNAGLLFILSGSRIAFYPDPTNGFALANGIQRWKITFFPAPPSFLKGLFLAAKPDQLATLRVCVSGAEKTPQSLYEQAEQLGIKLVEGYGITECSPVVAVNRIESSTKGVGAPLRQLEFCTIHPETLTPLPLGSEGEMCVLGPNVFSGYLNGDRTPFIEIDGKQWYRTGDLGHLDKDGSIVISGRLKRFAKLGGEMISLGAIESILLEGLLARGQITSDIPSLVICADERITGGVQLIAFTTIPVEKESMNETLKEAGFSNLIKLSFVNKLDEIPLLANGKIDYRQLQTFINEKTE